MPSPWSWAPLWALGAQTAIWVLPQVVGVSSPDALIEMAGLLSALGTLGFLTATLGLGMLAILLSSRPQARTVPIFPTSIYD